MRNNFIKDKNFIKDIQARSITDKPGLDELKARGEIGAVVTGAQYFAVRKLVIDLKKERIRQGLNQSQLAEKAELHGSIICRLENGDTLNPSLNTLFKYCLGLGIDLELRVK
jgi:DNA-binding XRE family transcriptional regulator